jgi:hypothetical protein
MIVAVARTPVGSKELRARIQAALAARLSPQHTRRATRIEGALALAILVPTLVFLAARSVLGYGRWRLQRELWRRDVERLTAAREHEPTS